MTHEQEEQEVREFLRERTKAIQSLSWVELDRYGKRTEHFRTRTGTSYRVVSRAFWDMGEWKSGIEIYVKARAPSGWHRWWRYKESASRGGPNDMVGEPPPGWKPRSRLDRRRHWRRDAS